MSASEEQSEEILALRAIFDAASVEFDASRSAGRLLVPPDIPGGRVSVRVMRDAASGGAVGGASEEADVAHLPPIVLEFK